MAREQGEPAEAEASEGHPRAPKLQALERTVPAPGEISWELDPAKKWLVTARLPGCWAADAVVPSRTPGATPLSQPREIRLRFWPAATLTGTFSPRRGEEEPEAASLRFNLPEGENPMLEKPLPSGFAACTVTGSSFQCSLPAGLSDLQVIPGGYAPVTRWGVTLAPGETKDLGAIALDPPAKIDGVVLLDNLPAKAAPVEVDLAPTGVNLLSPAKRERVLALEAATVHPERQGGFVIAPLAAGSYAVSAKSGAEWTSSRRSPLVLGTGDTLTVQPPLRLSERASLEITLEPPLDANGEPWEIEVARYLEDSSYRVPERQSTADLAGGWVAEGLAAGPHWIAVESSDGDRVWQKNVDLDGGRNALQVEVPLLAIVGRLHAGKEPIAAKLKFSRPSGSSVINIVTGKDGRFHGDLTGPGKWYVVADFAESTTHRPVGTFDVEPPPKEGPALIDLALPDTLVSGRVVEGNLDDGVAGAHILAVGETPGRSVAFTRSKKDGLFRFLGLDPGKVTLCASSGKRGSRSVPIELEPGAKKDDVTLKLQAKIEVSARVTVGGRPASGAQLWVGTPSCGAVFSGRRLVGPAGTTVIELLPGSPKLVWVGKLLGWPSTIGTSSLGGSGRQQIEIRLSAVGGRLVVPIGPPKQGTYLSRDGSPLVSVGLLFGPFPPDGSPPAGVDLANHRFSLKLAPGDYKVCPDSKESSACAEGYLAPNGWLELDPTYAKPQEK